MDVFGPGMLKDLALPKLLTAEELLLQKPHDQIGIDVSPLGNKDITKSSEHEIVSISHKLGKWILKFTSAFLRSFWGLQYKTRLKRLLV